MPVAEMDIRTRGLAPHRPAQHLCGGDEARRPDHGAEIDSVDLGENARFSALAALPVGLARHEDKFLELPHPADQGFLCRLSLNGTTNLVELEVKAGDTWRPVELPLRTVHTEIKLHGNHGWPGPEQAAGSSSRAWFDNVRIYPRPESHHAGVRPVRPDGGPIWFRENDGWPPRVVDASGKARSIEDLEVPLWTADGKTQMAAVRVPGVESCREREGTLVLAVLVGRFSGACRGASRSDLQHARVFRVAVESTLCRVGCGIHCREYRTGTAVPQATVGT